MKYPCQVQVQVQGYSNWLSLHVDPQFIVLLPFISHALPHATFYYFTCFLRDFTLLLKYELEGTHVAVIAADRACPMLWGRPWELHFQERNPMAFAGDLSNTLILGLHLQSWEQRECWEESVGIFKKSLTSSYCRCLVTNTYSLNLLKVLLWPVAQILLQGWNEKAVDK